jgi:hypothetical protein
MNKINGPCDGPVFHPSSPTKMSEWIPISVVNTESEHSRGPNLGN